MHQKQKTEIDERTEVFEVHQESGLFVVKNARRPERPFVCCCVDMELADRIATLLNGQAAVDAAMERSYARELFARRMASGQPLDTEEHY